MKGYKHCVWKAAHTQPPWGGRSGFSGARSRLSWGQPLQGVYMSHTSMFIIFAWLPEQKGKPKIQGVSLQSSVPYSTKSTESSEVDPGNAVLRCPGLWILCYIVLSQTLGLSLQGLHWGGCKNWLPSMSKSHLHPDLLLLPWFSLRLISPYHINWQASGETLHSTITHTKTCVLRHSLVVE